MFALFFSLALPLSCSLQEMADVKKFIEKYLPRIWPLTLSGPLPRAPKTLAFQPRSAILPQETAMSNQPPPLPEPPPRPRTHIVKMTKITSDIGRIRSSHGFRCRPSQQHSVCHVSGLISSVKAAKRLSFRCVTCDVDLTLFIFAVCWYTQSWPQKTSWVLCGRGTMMLRTVNKKRKEKKSPLQKKLTGKCARFVGKVNMFGPSLHRFYLVCII